MNEAISTKDLALLLGVSASTIGTWKSRNLGDFQLGIDFIKDGGAILWLPAGIEKMRGIQRGDAPAPSSESEPTPSSEPEPTPSSPPSQLSDTLLRKLAAREADKIEATGGRQKFLLMVARELMARTQGWLSTDDDINSILAELDSTPISAIAPSAPMPALEGTRE